MTDSHTTHYPFTLPDDSVTLLEIYNKWSEKQPTDIHSESELFFFQYNSNLSVELQKLFQQLQEKFTLSK